MFSYRDCKRERGGGERKREWVLNQIKVIAYLLNKLIAFRIEVMF